MLPRTEHSTAKQNILRGLGERVKAFGFSPKAVEQSFYHAFAAGKWALHVSFIPHQFDLDLTADVAIRINAIEDLVNKYDTKLTSTEKRKSMTLGGELGNISAGRQLRWSISDLTDTSRVCDQLADAFEQIGLQFLQTHSDVLAVHRALVSSEARDTILAPIPGPRFMRAVASAYVLGRKQDIPALAKRLEGKLVEKEDLYLVDFRSLSRELLETH